MRDNSIISWPDTPYGRFLLQWEQEVFDRWVKNVFGYHALQIGLPELDALRENRMPHRGFLAHHSGHSSGQKPSVQNCVQADPAALPFASQSIDLLVLPHVLEFSEDPHGILREAERVLLPQGQLMITSFNPFGLWRLGSQTMASWAQHALLSSEKSTEALNRISFIKLKDWLKLLGFECHRGCFGCYRPATRTEKWFSRFQFMESAGDRWWPVLGGVYALTAIKRVECPTLVGPWKCASRAKNSPELSPITTPQGKQSLPLSQLHISDEIS